MSDKQGQGERLCVIQDSDGDLWEKSYGAYITPIPQGEYGDLAEGDKLVAVYDPQTERVVPKDAEVWTEKQLRSLARSAVRHGVAMGESGNWEPGRKMIDELIAQARGKGE